jgi:hypothetical protein
LCRQENFDLIRCLAKENLVEKYLFNFLYGLSFGVPIGILLWQSAKKRGMNYKLWGILTVLSSVVVILPVISGIIFLLVRKPNVTTDNQKNLYSLNYSKLGLAIVVAPWFSLLHCCLIHFFDSFGQPQFLVGSFWILFSGAIVAYPIVAIIGWPFYIVLQARVSKHLFYPTLIATVGSISGLVAQKLISSLDGSKIGLLFEVVTFGPKWFNYGFLPATITASCFHFIMSFRNQIK